MVITRPPGYKLYTHLFHSAMRKLNYKIIKFQLLRRFTNDFKNMIKFDKYDYSKLDYEFYFGKRQITNNEIEQELYKQIEGYNKTIHNEELYKLKYGSYKETHRTLGGCRYYGIELIEICKKDIKELQEIIDNKNFSINNKWLSRAKNNISQELLNNLIENLKFNPYLDKLQNILNKYIDCSKKYNIELKTNGQLWLNISTNQYLTQDFIIKNINYNWNWYIISFNKNINFKLDFIEKHIDKPWWDFNIINHNPYITLEFIEKYIDKSWNWNILSLNKNITLEFIEKYIDKPWNFSHLSIFVEEEEKTKKEVLEYYNNIDYKVEKYTEKQLEEYYDNYKKTYSQKKKLIIPKTFVVKYFNKNWSLEWLLSDSFWSPDEGGGQLWTDITEDMLDKYPEKLCNYAYSLMIQRYGFSEEFMEKYVPKPWNWVYMLYRRNIPKNFRIKYMDEFLKVSGIGIPNEPNYAKNFWYDFTEEELEQFIDKIDNNKCNWLNLYHNNKNITEGFIIKCIEKPWGNQIFMIEKLWDAFMEKHKINITNVEFITADFYIRSGLQFYRFMPLSYCIKFINNYEIIQPDHRGREAWNQLSHNTNITKDFVKKYETKLPKLFIDGYLWGGRLTDEKNIPYLKPEQYTRSPWLNK